MTISVSDTSRSALAPGLDTAERQVRARRGPALAIVLLALSTAGAWLAFARLPLTPDESGFLLLAQHWSPGHSLYGAYWVDRPPLLLWLFSLPGRLGSMRATATGVVAPGVKILGAGAAGISVLLVGALARRTARPAPPGRLTAVVLAAALLSDPLLGMPETDGEVLAMPFVLLGLVSLLAALQRPWGHRAAAMAIAAGGAGMAAMLVKQNVVDVFVFATVLVALSRGRVSRLGRRVAAFAAGAAAVLCAAVAGAWAHGTTATGLWDAIVVFRLRASGVIGSSASAATGRRLAHLAAASVDSGAAVALVLGAAALLTHIARTRTERSRPEISSVSMTALAWATLTMIAWESIGILAGGSYWLHYLTGVIPGLALSVALVRPGRWVIRRALTLSVAYAALASVAVWTHHLLAPVSVSSEAQVSTYLREHALATDGVVVGFGRPDIVAGSGLRSPYEHLWSLPVRVRDPDLTELSRVMAGPSAPEWIVVAGDTLGTWGLNDHTAQRYLERHYVDQQSYGSWHIWQRQEPSWPARSASTTRERVPRAHRAERR